MLDAVRILSQPLEGRVQQLLTKGGRGGKLKLMIAEGGGQTPYLAELICGQILML